MAGHWIKWEKGLVEKPEVIQIARLMGINTREAAASCMLVWEWADGVTDNGYIAGVTPQDVSVTVGVPVIAETMEKVGWIVYTDDNLCFPNFTRHNTQTSKKRAMRATYMKDYRKQKKDKTA